MVIFAITKNAHKQSIKREANDMFKKNEINKPLDSCSCGQSCGKKSSQGQNINAKSGNQKK